MTAKSKSSASLLGESVLARTIVQPETTTSVDRWTRLVHVEADTAAGSNAMTKACLPWRAPSLA